MMNVDGAPQKSSNRVVGGVFSAPTPAPHPPGSKAKAVWEGLGSGVDVYLAPPVYLAPLASAPAAISDEGSGSEDKGSKSSENESRGGKSSDDKSSDDKSSDDKSSDDKSSDGKSSDDKSSDDKSSGEDVRAFMRSFYELTGRPTLPPLYALGFMASWWVICSLFIHSHCTLILRS
jgi:hypothetical protein